jgi:hypothetical protein
VCYFYSESYSLLFPLIFKPATMMRRVLHMSVLAVVALLLFKVSAATAQSSDRRGEPNILSTGYYVVDSDDDAPLPWRPNYFFVDTNYQPATWTRIGTGPRQFYAPGRYFYNPLNLQNPNQMDTTDNAMAGPIPIGFNFNFYHGNYDSLYISSNGFVGFRPYGEATGGTPPSYTRGDAQNLQTGFANAPRAIIAALWADLDMRATGDSTRVYVRTSPSLDTCMINFYNFRLRPGSPNNFSPSSTTSSGADRIFIKKFQVVFTRQDSSVQINYGAFSGAINNFPPILAWRLFQNNIAVGVTDETGGQATSVIFKNTWHAINQGCPNCNKNFRQSGQWAVKFKRWHNVVRAISVDYPPRNYEICLGTSVQPKATFKNVDSIMQSFKVRFQIRNVVTGIAVYGRASALLNMIPGEQRQVPDFTSYATNPNILNQLGTFKACAIATTFDTSDNNIGDRWPFDDTSCVRIFGIRTQAQPFNDASNNYSITNTGDIPDQQKWISIGAQVVDGEDATFDPPPPRDMNGVGGHQYKSPVIRMDRQDIEGNGYSGSGVGDTLLSFPINLQGQTKAGFSFDYQRGGRQTYPWLFDADVMYGPEHTVLNILGNVLRRGDSMAIEFKKPSEPACNPSSSGWNPIISIDGGHDFEFKKFFFNVESKLPGTNYFTNTFRFRLRLKAKFDGNPFNPPPTDDNDDWYVDNLALQVPRKPEIEVMWVRCVNPFTKIPASQAVALPLYVHIANNSSDVAIAFPIRVQVLDPSGNTVYWQTATVTSVRGGTDTTIQMPNWNAQDAGVQGEYTIHAWIAQPGYNAYEDDDGTYTLFTLNVEQGGGLTQEFAWDNAGLTPGAGAGNDWPAVTNLTGQGIGFTNNNGSFASKFRLVTKDTVYGVRVYYANANQGDDPIRISLLNGDPNSCTPADTVATFNDRRKGGNFNEFYPYYFPKPIVLAGGADAGATKGVYWISVSQLSIINMMNGANLSRGGGLIRVYDPFTPQIPPIYTSKYGTQASNVINNGDVSCAWAMEVTAGSGGWSAWTPSNGWWPTMASAGNPLAWRTSVNPSYMIWGGSYTPMIRPLVSRNILLPIDLLYLHGESKEGSALLTWATAREVNNQGFSVQRQGTDVKDAVWENIGTVASKVTNSNQTTGYAYTDNNVTPGTYNYRLIQRDLDGAERVTNTVTVAIAAPTTFALNQNYPNPFNPSTEITFNLPVAGETHLVIYNALGQLVRTLYTGNAPAGTTTVRWNAKDDSNNDVATGTYMYQITSGTFSATRKMTLTK